MERDSTAGLLSHTAFSSWESCIDKITEKYDEETAKKICGALRAEGNASLTASKAKPITKFTNEKGKLFVKAFLIDSSVNLNHWAVTKESIPKHINTFIGKPLILTADFGHPEEGIDTLSHMLKSQEGFRVGTITDINTKDNPTTGSTAYYAVIEITDPALRDSLLNTDIPHYVSPGIAEPAQLAELHPEDQIGTWSGMHLALVSNPAYGVNKARITNTCSGNKKDCLIQLMNASQKCNFCRYEALKEYRVLVASVNTSHAQKTSPNTKKDKMSQLESMDSTKSADPTTEAGSKSVEKVEEPQLLNKAPVPQSPQAPRGMRDILEENQRLLHELELSHLKIQELTDAHTTVQERLAALEVRERRKDIERIITPDIVKDDKQRLAKIKELTASQIPIDQIETLYKEMRVLVKKASVNQRAAGTRVPYVTSNLNTVGSTTAVENDGDDLTLLDKQLFCIDRRT